MSYAGDPQSCQGDAFVPYAKEVLARGQQNRHCLLAGESWTGIARVPETDSWRLRRSMAQTGRSLPSNKRLGPLLQVKTRTSGLSRLDAC